jgi:predicted Zn-dependent protease
MMVLLPLTAPAYPGFDPQWAIRPTAARARALALWARLVRRECRQPVCQMANYVYGAGGDVLWAHRNIDEAFEMQLRAFGADPYDAEVASNLASLYLQVSPAQPGVARQVVMHAMALSSARLLAPRVQDWNTLAVANALMGREDDAAHALFVTAAIANNLGVSCRAALNAAAHYGDRMRVPVESMLLRIHEQGRDYESPYCVWPPRWTASGRFY